MAQIGTNPCSPNLNGWELTTWATAPPFSRFPSRNSTSKKLKRKCPEEQQQPVLVKSKLPLLCCLYCSCSSHCIDEIATDVLDVDGIPCSHRHGEAGGILTGRACNMQGRKEQDCILPLVGDAGIPERVAASTIKVRNPKPYS